MLSISKPQTNLIYLSILPGRLDLTRFNIQMQLIYVLMELPTTPHFTHECEP